VTDEEFQALRERYRRAGDAWSNQLDTVRRAEKQAARLLAEFQDLEQRLTAEQYRRYREAEREQG
jgi:ribosomal 30S subunit maturation factor RimM